MRNKTRIKERYEEAKLAYTALMLLYPLTLENLPGEIWAWVDGYEGLYQVSTFGRIKSFYKNKIKIRRPTLSTGGYLQVGLHKKGDSKTFDIHRLVAKAFLPNPNNLMEINHKFGNKFDNYYKNLEWCTDSENKQHAVKTGLIKIGEERTEAKFTDEQVCWIRENYKRNDKEFGLKAMAEKFNVNARTITRVLRRETYKNVE